MSASKMIFRNLSYTVLAILVFLFAVSFTGVGSAASASATVTTPVVGDHLDQENLGNEGIEDIGGVLDGVVFDFAA